LGISFVAIGVGTAITLGVLVFTGVLAFSPNEMIPVSGMVVNNAMVAIGLVYRNLITTIQNRRAEVEVKLSLGADPKEATKEIVKECLRLAMSPTVDAAKALGIVSLPGMMTGLILAGESPLIAIQFQIMVTFMLLASVSIATALASYFAYQAFFTPRKQLK
jgi:putative ABC transport system permease protein